MFAQKSNESHASRPTHRSKELYERLLLAGDSAKRDLLLDFRFHPTIFFQAMMMDVA